jgi:plastocyanin
MVLLLAACTSPGTNQLPTVTTVHLTEYRITPATLSLDAGIYTFTGVNDGTISHALELTGNGIDGHTPDLAYAPGHSEGFTVTLKPGTYQFFCPIDGHRGLGMQGTLVVH